jgi:hypothetical protein
MSALGSQKFTPIFLFHVVFVMGSRLLLEEEGGRAYPLLECSEK